jgi:putative spermidine/putrescine transport system substrate-binding protein
MSKLKILSLILVACFLIMLPVAANSEPTKIVIIDVAGEQPLVQTSLDTFAKENPDLVSSIELMPATAPELSTKIKAEQAAGNINTTFVFTGYDGLCGGIELGIYDEILPKYKDKLPGLEDSFTDAAKLQFGMSSGQGIPHACSPGGPMFTYNPDKVKAEDVPTTVEELLAWAKANPGKFFYPRPMNSGAGYAWLQGLPYLLGEKDPAGDPEKWEKVWPYLQELGKYIDYYPTGSGIAYKELAEGTRWLICTAVGFETNQRVLETMPLNFKQGFYKNAVWVSDANFICIPKGLDEARLNTSLKLLAYLMTPEQQAYNYDGGFMYPGPAVKGVTLDMAPKESQDALKAVLTPELLAAIDNIPYVAPLKSEYLVKAFDMWDRLVGSKISQ